jgi:hypothetical protein
VPISLSPTWLLFNEIINLVDNDTMFTFVGAGKRNSTNSEDRMDMVQDELTRTA